MCIRDSRYVELISEGFDMAIRVGELEDSTLRARKLTDTAKRMIGAPNYFSKYGRPQKIDDLNEHKLLHYSNQASGNVWKITAPSGEKRQVRTAGWLTVNDGQSPVSYTHLDVYKRQALRQARSPLNCRWSVCQIRR